MKKKATILGAGISGLSAASFLAKSGWDVTILEKNPTIGGRARQFSQEGFTFDMGPSWYWMPDVFENFFNDFGTSVKDFYDLKRLDPSYRVFWKDQPDDIPAKIEDLTAYFEKYKTESYITSPVRTILESKWSNPSSFKFLIALFVGQNNKSLIRSVRILLISSGIDQSPDLIPAST